MEWRLAGSREVAQLTGDDVMHLVEKWPGKAPQRIVVAELSGETLLPEIAVPFSCRLFALARSFAYG
jgi:hypothetical protein